MSSKNTFFRPLDRIVSTSLKSLNKASSLLSQLLLLAFLMGMAAPATAAPTVDGVFYAEGDNAEYIEWGTSVYGSKLYIYYDPVNLKLYAALVVNRAVNDNVFTSSADDSNDYMQSTGWGGGGGQQRSAVTLVDSEFAQFTFQCAPGNTAKSWTWSQGYARLDGGVWVSDEEGTGSGAGTAPPGYESSSSFAYNINTYISTYGTTGTPGVATAPGSSPAAPWNMYFYGNTIDKWKSPFEGAGDTVIGLSGGGYPASGDITYYNYDNNSKKWEWPLVYEWSVDMGPAGADCGNNAIYTVTGLSHHSPLKADIEDDPDPACYDPNLPETDANSPENDCFVGPPGTPNDNVLSDYGDLPDTYGTLKSSNGARHYITAGGVYLGSRLDMEADGNPDTSATGDNNAGVNDEDGVTPDLSNGNWTAGSTQTFNVVSSGAGLLGVWLDWNEDGDFDDPGEYFTYSVVAGNNSVPLAGTSNVVPAGFDWQTMDLNARFRLFSSSTAAPGGSLDSADYVGVATDGEVEDYVWGVGDVSTLPVTIAYLKAVPSSNNLRLEWSTATETSNVGFYVYAVINDEWIKINEEMLPGSLDSLEPKHYNKVINNPYGRSLTEIGIAGVDVNGVEDFHGPYPVGKVQGKKPFAEKINWGHVRKEMKAGLDKRKTRIASTIDTGKDIKNTDIIHVDVDETGLYRITDQDLRAAGLSMPGIVADQIAISFRGEAVARHVGGLNNKGKWSNTSWIEFIGEAPSGRDAVYLNAKRYQLSRDTSLVLDAPAFDKPEVAPARFEANNRYAFTIPSEDPWYDAKFYAIGTGRPGSLSRSFDLPGLQEGEAELTIYTSALSQGTHHMIVELNGTVIDDVRTEGWTPWVVTIPVSSSELQETANVLTLKLPGDSSDFDYVLYDKLEVSYSHSGKAETLSASLQRAEMVSRNSLSRGRADLLVISHPALMGEALDGYIADRNAEGWSTKLVDVFDIYQAYGYGMATPSAITDYLDDAREMGYSHVQLVGAASYDYRDYLGLGSVSFIPSIYEHTAGIIKYTPCDSCLVMDDSLKPAAAIGRWPVHSPAELQAVIDKGRAWANGQATAHTYLLIADSNDEKNDFVSQVEETTKQLVESDDWNGPARVYLDDAIAAAVGDVDAGLAAAKADLIAALEAGASITVFSGHGAPSTWSFKGLLKQQDIAGIQNAGKPTLALPLTCYTTYAESPYTSSLAHQLMAAGENAAVAVYGAATLSSFRHNSEMGKRVISGLLEDQTLGESIMNGKLDLNSSYRDVIINSNLLGDVTLKLQ